MSADALWELQEDCTNCNQYYAPGGNFMSDLSAFTGGLSSLAPTYDEEHHAAYVTYLHTAITNEPPVHNVAIAGAYGTGKSSILLGLKQRLLRDRGHRKSDDLIEISLSSLNPSAQSPPQPRAESSVSAVLQKEIIKRLLYSEVPRKLPLSRFKRIAEFAWRRALSFAAIVTILLLAAILLVFGATALGQYFKYRSFPTELGVVLASILVLAILYLGQYVLHRQSVLEISFGAATVKLSDNHGTYFDQYLDEILYFFKHTRTRYVVFEDLDRFNDPTIFRALRDLNSLLNSAKSIQQDVVFIYAVRDSLFEQRREPDDQVPNAPTSESIASPSHRYGVNSPASDRAKFFDLIIPIVPFISRTVSADLLLRELRENEVGDAFRPSRDLISLAGRYFTDMRVIRSIANEYHVYATELLAKSDIDGLTPDKQFAMVLYKHADLADFEKIRSGESKLDRLAKIVRETATKRVQAIDDAISELHSEAALARKVAEQAEGMGERLEALLQLALKAEPNSAQGRIRLVPGDEFDMTALRTVQFWDAFIASPPRRLVLNGSSVTLSPTDIERFIWQADFSGFRRRAEDERDSRISTLQNLRTRIVGATFAELLMDDSLLDSSTHQEFSHVLDCGRKILGDGLALELVRAGYIDNSYVLYASTYYGELLSADARSFMLQVMDQHQTAPDFWLSREDVEAILEQPGYFFLNSQSALNISVFEHLIEDDRLEPALRRVAAGTFDRDSSFVRSFLARSNDAAKLVSRLSPIFDKVLDVIAESEQLAPDRKLHLLSTALAHLSSAWKYTASDATAELIARKIDNMPVVREDLSEDHSAALAAFLKHYSIKLASLEQMHEYVRKFVVGTNGFAVTLQNLLLISPNTASVGIDTLSRVQDSLAAYLLENPGDYLDALESAEPKALSIDNPERLSYVLATTTDLDGESLYRLLSLAHPDAVVEHIVDAPPHTWSSLARTKRFIPTATNVIAYLGRAGDTDYYVNLSRYLARTRKLVSPDEVNEDQRVGLAVWLVNQATIPARTKLSLLSQLEPIRYLPLSELRINDRQLLAGLVQDERIADTAETFKHFALLPWDQKELALAKSTDLPEFVTDGILRAEELEDLIQSPKISDEVKKAVLAGVQSLEQSGALSKGLVNVIVDFAVTNNVPVPLGDLSLLAANGASSPTIAKLLGRNLENLTDGGILEVLSQLDGGYEKLAVADGKRPKLKTDGDVLQLLDRLKQMELVNQYRFEGKDGVYIRVSMKRRQA